MQRTTGRIARLIAVALIAALLPGMAVTAGPVGAASPQGIDGTITESGTGDALPGIWVLAWSNASTTFVSGTVTDQSGAYVLDLAVGDYKLEFVDPSSGHDVEWYDGRGFEQSGDADPISVLTDQTVIANADLDVPTGTLTGTILEEGTGTPIPNAWVAALNSSGNTAAMIQADTSGEYTMSAVEPGMYRVAGMDPTGNHDVRLSPATTIFHDATTIVVTAGGNADADVTLPSSTPVPATDSITGTITDDVSGQALPGMWVVALQASSFQFTAGAVADSAGEYSIPLPEGDYYLQFFDPTRAHRFEWYEDQAAPASIGDLTVVTTGSVSDAGLAPLTGDLAGIVAARDYEGRLEGVWVAAFGNTDGRPVAGDVTGADGSYQIPGLATGEYTILFADPTGVHAAEYYDFTPYEGSNLVPIVGGRTATIDYSLTGGPPA